MYIGLKIRKARAGLKLTVRLLAVELGISHGYLTLIENRKRPLPKELVAKLARVLKLPKATVYEWYLEQELIRAGIKDKKSHELIKMLLKMTLKEKESLLKVIRSLEKKDNPRS